MAPTPTGTASCMYLPRLRTVRTASAKFRVPAATWAEYSPRLWPATNAGLESLFVKDAPGRDRSRQNGGLGDFGEAKLFFRSFEAKLAKACIRAPRRLLANVCRATA